MRDRLQYEICHRLWIMWHARLRDLFGRYDKHGNYYGIIHSRPRWHLCCNGDCGGWRTSVCNWLEHRWRYTRHYEHGE